MRINEYAGKRPHLPFLNQEFKATTVYITYPKGVRLVTIKAGSIAKIMGMRLRIPVLAKKRFLILSSDMSNSIEFSLRYETGGIFPRFINILLFLKWLVLVKCKDLWLW